LESLDQLVARGNEMRDFCKQPQLALADYSAAIDSAPLWADPYRERARLYAMEGRFKEALADIDKAVELQPSWIDAVKEREQLYTDPR